MKQRPSLMLLLVIALLVLLPLLAVLQYRWLGEVSAADRERRQANLKTSADRFCSDFDRELTNAYLQLQTAAPVSDERDDVLAVRYQRLLTNAPRPKLIREIYRARFDEQGQFALAHFNQSTQALEAVEWPENLKSIRAKFEAQRQVQESTQMMLRTVLGQTQEQLQTRIGRGVVFQISTNQIADDIPALVIPDIGPHLTTAPIFPEKRSNTIAVLNLEYIQSELIPDLARRHFLTDGTNDYNLAIIRRSEAKEVIFQTDTGLPIKSFEQSDIKSSLFKIRPEEVDRLMIAGVPPPIVIPATPASPTSSSSRIVKSESNQVAVSVFQSDINIKNSKDDKPAKLHAESALPKPEPKPESSIAKQFLKRGEEGCWQLLVKHRAGSLDAAVAGVRRRNLGISFGILLLLGVSVGFIVLSSRRSQHLAKQQMEFVAGVSHELRTPLAVICSAAENLADGVIDNQDQIKRYGGRRLTGMVEQVLEFAGAQSGRKTYELRPTELHRVIEDALAACHLQLIEGEFQIEKQIPADLPPIKADAAALSRALQNLLSNAMKYSGDNRWIGLTVETVPSAQGGEVQIRISDRGLGIAPSELPHIFEPFYRGKEVVASQIHGNGLGLSLVKHIVEAHGGRLTVESQIGQGSSFIICLTFLSQAEVSSEKMVEEHLSLTT
ncbi:MAG TPA: HAMP domain-containing sensor histidine kinase [Blastocatellia bacterium]|nr:HAMP domain-containing sensor histidine kinase [Blastocatellia bacterium]